MPGSGFIVNENGEIIANESGETMVILSYENAMKTNLVSIGKQNKQTGFISGDDYIRITKTAEYKLTIPNLNGDIK